MAKTASGVASVHSANFINSGVNKLTLFKAAAHGVARGAIQSAQGGSFKAGFMSGFSSGFDVGTSAMGGNTVGGFVARTVTMGIVGGTASALGGGKFSNGAMSGAFTHMFNAEGGGSSIVDKAKSGLTILGGALQIAAGGALISSGIGAPLGAAMIGLGTNNIISGTTGYNPIQSGLEYVSNGALGAKTYTAIDLGLGGASMLTKVPRVVDSVVFGKQIIYPTMYQTTSRSGLVMEAGSALNTGYGAVDHD